MKTLLLNIVAKVLAESKRIAIYAFTVAVLALLLVVLVKLGAPESVQAIIAGALAGSVNIALSILLHGVTKTDVAEAAALPAGHAPGAGEEPEVSPGAGPPPAAAR